MSARPSSQLSSDRGVGAGDAEEPLLRSGHRDKHHSSGVLGDKWKQLALLVWAVVATAGVVVLGTVWQHEGAGGTGGHGEFPPKGKRNVIFMVSDGMGPTSLELTRSWRQYAEGLHFSDTLLLDKHLIGTSRTRSTSSLVTDSAAGATAFSCGKKSYNGAISVLPDHSPCGTVLEAAKKAGYMTGLVVTTRITDATPACFSAHVNYRSEEDRIAEQQIGINPLGRVVDLMLGGGRCHFLPKSLGEESCRLDDRDIVAEAKDRFGFSYVDDRASFDTLKLGKNVQFPLLGLFATGDIPYDIDRKDEDYPALWEMAKTALTALQDATKDSDKGFFLMVEGSRIDHAGHANDPAAQVREVLAYDRAFKEVLDWVENSGEQAVVVSTSDHETGGLAAARQLQPTYPDYLWYPSVLNNASHSGEFLSAQLAQYSTSLSTSKGSSEKKLSDYIKKTIVQDGLGITDASEEEIQNVQDNKLGSTYVLNDMVSRRAQIGWSTHGHSGVDVNIYGSFAAIPHLTGNHENTEIGEFIRNYLELDLDSITKKLKDNVDLENERGQKWMGKSLWELRNQTDEVIVRLDEYHGEFRKRGLEELNGLEERGCDCGGVH